MGDPSLRRHPERSEGSLRRHFCSLSGMNHSSANEKNLYGWICTRRSFLWYAL
jgi:hypothetical protein